MDNRSLMLLGLLMSQSQHGYQIHDFIEKNLKFITDIKKPTAYATLDKLSRQGYIEVQVTQEGNRPPRKVYSINDKGIAYFNELLLKNLATAEQVFYDGDIGLMFVDYLPSEKTLPALKKRLVGSKKLLANVEKTPSHGNRIGVNIAVQHKKTMLETEIAFLEKTIRQLEESK